MNVARLITRPCTITNRADSGGVDEYGNPTTAETIVDGLCDLQQFQRLEDRIDAVTQTSRWNLFLLPDAVIDGLAFVTIDGVNYEVDGPPYRERNPRTGVFEYIEATVRQVT